MAPQDHNLKSQLSDIQKRLSESTFNTPKRSSTLRRDNDNAAPHVSPSPDSQSRDQHQGLSEKKSFGSLISRRDSKRVSLPALDNNKSLSSPAKGTGKDMDFVVGLSENLLQECRRLQAENQTKSKKLKAVEDDFAKIKASNAALMAKLNDNMQLEEKYKDTNWELETKLQHLTQELSVINDNHRKTQKELIRQMEESHQMRLELEEINMNKASLEKDFSSNKVTASNEIQDLRSHVDELNDENTRLNDEIDGLRKQLETSVVQPKITELKHIPVLRPEESSDEEGELQEPPMSPVKAVSLDNDALQTETLKVSLQNAHQTIAKLRAQILKLRQSELSSKQSQHSFTPRKGQSPMGKKKGLPESLVKNLHIMGNTNRASAVIYDESLTSMEEDDWENFEGDSTSIVSGSPSKKPQRPRSIISTTSRELMSDSDSDFEDTAEYPAAPLSSELKLITDEDATCYAEENRMVILPIDDYEKLINITEDELHTHAASKGLVLLPTEEKETMVSGISLKEKHIAQLTQELSQREQKEETYQREAREFKEKLDAAVAELEKKDTHARNLKAQIDAPSEDFLHAAAAKHNLCLISALDHESLQRQIGSLREHFEQPSHNFLKEKAQSKNLTLLPVEEHSCLLAQLDQLNKAVLSHESTTRELQTSIKSAESRYETTVREHLSAISHAKSESLKKIEELQARIDNPATDYIKEKGEALGFVVLERSAYEKTLGDLNSTIVALKADLEVTKSSHQSQLENPTIDYLKNRAAVHGYLTIDKSAHEKTLDDYSSSIEALKAEVTQQQKSISSPSLNYIKEKAASHGYLTLDQAVHDQAFCELNSSLDSLKSELESTKAEYQKQIEDPTLDYLKDKVSSHNLLVIDKSVVDEFTVAIDSLKSQVAEQQKTIESPSLDYIKEKSALHGHLAIDRATHEASYADLNSSLDALRSELETTKVELERQIDDPPLNCTREKASLHGHLTVDRTTHEKTLGDITASIEALTIELSAMKSDYQNRIDNPSLDYIQNKAGGAGHKVLAVSVYDEQISQFQSTIASLEEQVASLQAESGEKSALIDELKGRLEEVQSEFSKITAGYEDLQSGINHHKQLIESHAKQISAPSKDYLIEHVGKQGLSVLPKVAHVALLESANRTIHDLAAEGNYVVLKQDVHSDLTEKALNPSVDHLVTISEKKGYKTIALDEHEALHAKASKTIEELATEKGVVLVQTADYFEMRRLIDTPTVAEVGLSAKALGLVVIPEGDHDDHIQSIKSLEEDVALFKDEIVKKDAYIEELTLTINEKDKDLQREPVLPKDSLLKQVSALGLVTLNASDYKSLRSPSKKDLEEHAEAYEHVLVPSAKYADIKQRASKTLDDLANEARMVVLSYDDHQQLLTPSQDLLLTHAKKRDHILVSNTDYNAIKSKSERTAADLANESGLVLLTQDEHDVLLSPSIDTLTSKIEAAGKTVLDKFVHDDLVARSQRTASDLAAEEGLVLLKPEEHQTLVEPSASALALSAGAIGLTLLAKNTHEELVVKSQRTAADLAADENLVILTPDEHRALLEPHIDDLISKVEARGMAVMNKTEHDKLIVKAKKSAADIATEENLILLTLDEHQALIYPSVDSLKSAASTRNMTLLSTEDHDALQARATLKASDLASEENLVLLRPDVYKSLAEPSAESMVSNAAALGKILVDEKSFDELVTKANRNAADLAAEEGLVLLETEKYESLVTPSASALSLTASALGMTLLPHTEHEYLVARSKQTIEDLAVEKGLILVEPDNYKELTEPSLEKIESHAAEHGHVLVSEEVHKKLFDLDTLTVTDLSDCLSKLSHVAVSKDVYRDICADPTMEQTLEFCNKHGIQPVGMAPAAALRNRAAELGLIAVGREDYDILKAKAEDPDKRTLEAHASRVGCVLIGKKEYASLQKVTKKDLEVKAEKIDHVLVSKQDWFEAQELGNMSKRTSLPPPGTPSTPPSKFAATKDYFETVSRSADKESRKAKVFESAKSLGFVPVAADEYKHLLEHQKEHVVTKSNIYLKAKDHNLTVLPHDEYKSLLRSRQRDSMTLDDIQVYAQSFGMKLVDADMNVSSSTSGVAVASGAVVGAGVSTAVSGASRGGSFTLLDQSSTSTLSSVLNESEFTDALSRQPSNASTIHGDDVSVHGPSLDEIRLQASALGYTVVPITGDVPGPATPQLVHDGAILADDEGDDSDDDHHDTLVVRDVATPFDTILSRDFIHDQASNLGLVVLEQSDYEALALPTFTEAYLTERAAALGFKVVSDADIVALENPKEEKVKEFSAKLGLIALSESEIQNVEAQAVANVRAEDLVTEESIGPLATNFGLTVLPNDKYADLLQRANHSEISKEEITQSAASAGLIMLSAEEYEKLKSEAHEASSLSAEKIVLAASALGLSVLTAEKVADMSAPKALCPDELKEHASLQGLQLVDSNELEKLSQESNLSRDVSYMRQSLESHGLVSISRDEYEMFTEKSKDLTKDELVEKANAFGLVVMTSQEQADLLKKKETGVVPVPLPVITGAPQTEPAPVTKEMILTKCSEFGLVAISESEYKSLKMQFGVDSLLSRSDVVQRAMEYDLVAVSKKELKDLRTKAQVNRDLSAESLKNDTSMETGSPDLSSEEVESWARSHDLLLIPEEAFVATNVSRIPDPQNVVVLPVTYYNKLTKSETFNLDKVTNDELQAQARKRGFNISTTDHIGSGPLTRNNTITSLSTSHSRKNIAEIAAAAAVAEYDQQSSRVSRASSRGPSRANSVNAARIGREASVDGGLSLLTNASLSEPNIIPALTQTVIGEYLFKYYRRLGPLSSISESRHERYFWIHPYTLTLYWSTTNPVLGDPSAHKTKAAAIISVESVEDNNPLPAGLYHKSIVVHSQNRSIKFTCPTRQRHNIWLNSLRYLIQRSMDGINLEEDLGLPAPERI